MIRSGGTGFFTPTEPDVSFWNSIKLGAVEETALAPKPLISPRERCAADALDRFIIPWNRILSCRGSPVLRAWRLRDQGSRRSLSSRSLYLVSESSTPWEREAKVLSATILSSHSTISGSTVTLSFSFSFIEWYSIPPHHINTSVIIHYLVVPNTTGAATNMFLNTAASQVRISSSGPASSFILLSSPKTKEGLSEGMGLETKKESVRVCNVEGIGPGKDLPIVEVEGCDERVERDGPVALSSRVLLPSTLGSSGTIRDAVGASVAP